MAASNWLSQVAAVTQVSLQSVSERKGAAAAAIFGIAGVTAVLVGVLSIAQGFRRAMTVSAAPDTVIVIRSGADSEMMSGLGRAQTRLIADSPHILRTAQGPLSSAELFVVINLPKRSTGTDANVPLRGVEPAAFSVRSDLKIIQGRRFVPGRNEVVVGEAAVREFAGLTLGSKFAVGRNEWEVVGIFACNGGIAESEIWTDAAVLQPAYQRGDAFQSVYARLKFPADFNKFKAELESNPQLNVKTVRQADYYAEQSTAMYALITGLGTSIALLMAIGAAFGALNTMYTAIAARTREIATLRALGFGAGPVVISVMLESLGLALAGGVVGTVGAYFAFDGYQAATMNFQTFSQVAFSFAVTPRLLVDAIVLALSIGFVGGLFPAIRAARLPIATALRES